MDLKKKLKRKLIFGLISFIASNLVVIIIAIVVSVVTYQLFASGGSFETSNKSKSNAEVPLEGNELTIYKYLKSKGYNDIMICGIMGNMYVESGHLYDPNAIQSKSKDIYATGGIGLCQWTSKGRKDGLLRYVKSKSRTGSTEFWNNINYQLDYLCMEMDPNEERGGYASLQWCVTSQAKEQLKWMDWSRSYTNQELWDIFTKLTDVNKATEFFCWLFERPATKTANLDTRKQKANELLVSVHTKTSNSKIDYVNWAVDVANNDKHGYCQHQNHRGGTPDYDCSSLVFYALKNTGYNVGGSPFSTSSEANVLKNAGFKCYRLNEIGADKLKEGDILLVRGHTEIYIGNSQNVGAHIDTSGDIYCKAGNGDQNGQEISIQNSSNTFWTYVFRKE